MKRTILIHPLAPAKPAEGQPCNGCGVCCLAEPCPVGVVFSMKFKGACRMLVWHEPTQLYRCGLMLEQASRPKRRWGAWWHRTAKRLFARWIAAGQGCDSDFEMMNENS